MKTMNSKLKESGMKLITTAAVILATFTTLNVYGATFENRMKATAEMNNFACYLAEEKDPELKPESWMLDKDNFFNVYPLEAAAETPLTMESWMTDANLFPAVADLEKETEEMLRVTDWMLNDSLFNQSTEKKTEPEILAHAEPEKVKRVIGVTFEKERYERRAFIIFEVEDPKLNMEQWMVDYGYWRKK